MSGHATWEYRGLIWIRRESNQHLLIIIDTFKHHYLYCTLGLGHTLLRQPSLFVTANSGAAAGGILFFCSYIPYLFIQPRYAEMTLTQKVASCLISNIAMSHGGLIIGMFEGTGKYFCLSIYPATLRWDDLDPEGGLLSDIQHRHVAWRPHHWNVWGHR